MAKEYYYGSANRREKWWANKRSDLAQRAPKAAEKDAKLMHTIVKICLLEEMTENIRKDILASTRMAIDIYAKGRASRKTDEQILDEELRKREKRTSGKSARKPRINKSKGLNKD